MKMLQNPRKLKNSPNLLVLFVKVTKFLEFSKKITIKTIVFSNSVPCLLPAHRWLPQIFDDEAVDIVHGHSSHSALAIDAIWIGRIVSDI